MSRSPFIAIPLVALVAFAAGCPPRPVKPTRVDKPFVPEPVDQLRLVLIGDTGAVNEHMRALRVAVMAERKDAVIVLGDLVYPLMPECPEGRLTAEAQAELDRKVGGNLNGLGAPVLVTLGNHDTDWRKRDNARQACLMTYAADQPDIVFPAENFVVDWGVALLAFVNTNRLTASNGRMVREAFAEHKGWTIGLGHHVLRTYRDKIGEQIVARWLRRERITPHLWANGHAHLLQYGVYGGIPAVTSGTGAYPRERPGCPPKCGKGEVWGSSAVGYATLDISAEAMVVTFKDTDGRELFQTTIARDKPSATPGDGAAVVP